MCDPRRLSALRNWHLAVHEYLTFKKDSVNNLRASHHSTLSDTQFYILKFHLVRLLQLYHVNENYIQQY
jgi:hypothetical protein